MFTDIFPVAKIMQICLILLMPVLFLSCNETERPPDTSHIHITLQTRRLDKALYQLDTLQPAAGLLAVREAFPDFLDFYLDTLLGFGIRGQYTTDNPAISEGVYQFLTHPDYRGVFDSVAAHFPDTRAVEESLTEGFKYLQYYFPAYQVPGIVYFVSGLNNWAVLTYDSLIGIGLDMYLGADYPFYRSVGIPDYMSSRFQPVYIAPNVFQAVYRDWHPFVMEGSSLLDMMLQRGKEQYFLEKITPFTPDSVRLGFTAAQLTWCTANEAHIYNFFVKEDLLYETNWQKILRYVHDGPNAAGMPPESPGNVGSWLGLQIVKAYMGKHPQLSLAALLQQQTDARQFLQGSGYKPR